MHPTQTPSHRLVPDIMVVEDFTKKIPSRLEGTSEDTGPPKPHIKPISEPLIIAMLLLPFVLLLSSPRPEKVWYIDANNVLGHRGTPRDPDVLTRQLQQMVTATSELRVVVVFDGNPASSGSHRQEGDAMTSSSLSVDHFDDRFQRISLGSGVSADDFILSDIQSFQDRHPNPRSVRVQVVTADRELRRKVREHSVVRGVVNPVTFWRRYLPRLAGAKGRATTSSSPP